MGNERISGKAGQAYASARDNQYVRRLIEDEELRASLIAAALADATAGDELAAARDAKRHAWTDRDTAGKW